MILASKKIIKLIKKNIEIFFLFLLLLISIISTTFYNNNKFLINENYKDIINNTYFQKSINHFFNNLTPRYKNINHKISKGETFDKILNSYSISNEEILEIKKNLVSNYNLNDLKTNLDIKFTIDQSNNKKIISFLFPISRTKKIQLTRNKENDLFKKETIITNLIKKIIYKEGKILKSLYKTAIDLNVQPNIIIEYARIYGFQVDFQRDIRKNDNFKIMYEIFIDENNKIFETGNILYADLKLSGTNNSLYYFKKKEVKDIMIIVVRVLKRH